MKNKIYLITEYYHENQNTTGYLLGKLYKFLNNQSDIDLVLITKKDDFCPEYDNAHFLNAPKLNKKSLFKRFLYEVIISFKFFLEIIKNVKKDNTVFTGTTPIFLLIIIFFTKKIMGYRWILLVHDVFPENLIAAKILKKNNYFYKFLKYFFDKVYGSADQVIVIGHDMKNLVYGKTNLNNIHVVQNWIDYEDIDVQHRSGNQILNELSWSNSESVIFQFFGNIGRVQGVDIIFQAIQKMKYLDLAKFLFIGNGAYVSSLEEQIRNSKLSHNIVYWGELDQKEKSIGLNACDVAIVTLAEGMLGLGVPSKSYFTMAADKPILAIMDEESEVSTMVTENNIGWTVSPNIDALAAKLDEIVLNFRQYNLKSSRHVLIENYSESLAMQKILKIINISGNK